jgi:hypothetical protein
MQAFLAVDREAVRGTILKTTTEANFNGMMRAIYADFAGRRRCSSAMQVMICYYLGGQVSDQILLEDYICGRGDEIAEVQIVESPSEDIHISDRQLPILPTEKK